MIRIRILSLFIILFAFSGSLRAEEVLQLVVLDVGEGQSVLLVRNRTGVLIDTGLSHKSSMVAKSLEAYGVESLEAIILTHLHPDHAGGVFALKKRYPEALLYESGHRTSSMLESVGYHRLAEAMDSIPCRVELLHQHDGMVWQKINLAFLWPKNLSGGSVNGHSLVIHVQFGSENILIMGDAGIDVEATLLKEEILPENIDLLIVGHHGAKDASSKDFLERIRPAEAVISVNRDNQNGYPDKDVIQRLQKYTGRVHITFRDGDVMREYSLAD